MSPHGGELSNLIVGQARAAEMKATAKDHPSLTLDERGLCDLELLALGSFSPLKGFLRQADYERVVAEGRLANGMLWPLPINLPVSLQSGADVGKILALRDVYGNLLAFLHVEELYEYDRQAEARLIYGTTDPQHPAVAHLNQQPSHYAAGRLEVLRTPPHHDFVELRRTPSQLREELQSLGWSKVIALHASHPLHRVDEEATKRLSEQVGGGLMIQPIVGMTRPGDVDHFTQVRCFRALVDNHFDSTRTKLSLLPYSKRKAGPRETLLHGIIARNHGCTHVALTETNSPHTPELIREHERELGITFLEAPKLVYVPETDRYLPVESVPAGTRTARLSEEEVRDDYLLKGMTLPEWFTRPEVAEILRETHPPRHLQGLTIWFTGLSGSGKSTVAHALVERLAEYGRNVSLLDGDEIRTHLSKGLGFSKEDRDINIRRVGFVAGLVAQHGGTTLCSVISPYRAPREEARRASKGRFVEVYCDTPLDVCEARDVKGLYASARTAAAEGRPMGFTGVDDPYQPPLNPEVTIDTSKLGVQESADTIIRKLLELGYLLPHGHRAGGTGQTAPN